MAVCAMIAILRKSVVIVENNFGNIFDGTVNSVAAKVFEAMVVGIMV